MSRAGLFQYIYLTLDIQVKIFVSVLTVSFHRHQDLIEAERYPEPRPSAEGGRGISHSMNVPQDEGVMPCYAKRIVVGMAKKISKIETRQMTHRRLGNMILACCRIHQGRILASKGEDRKLGDGLSSIQMSLLRSSIHGAAMKNPQGLLAQLWSDVVRPKRSDLFRFELWSVQ